MINIRSEKMRSQVSDGPDGLTITIPTKKNIFMLIFLAVWLVVWAVGEVTVPTLFLFGKTLPSVRLFSAVWLAAWTIAGMFAIYVWLWNIAGREIIRITSKGIVIKRAVFGYGIERQYDMVYIKTRGYPRRAFLPGTFHRAFASGAWEAVSSLLTTE